MRFDNLVLDIISKFISYFSSEVWSVLDIIIMNDVVGLYCTFQKVGLQEKCKIITFSQFYNLKCTILG